MSETLLKGCHRGIVGNQVPYIATGWTSLFKFQLSEGLIYDFHLKSIILKIQTCRFSTQRCDLGMGSTLSFGHLWSWDPNLPKTVDSKNLYSLTSPRGPGCAKRIKNRFYTWDNKQTGYQLTKELANKPFRACPQECIQQIEDPTPKCSSLIQKKRKQDMLERVGSPLPSAKLMPTFNSTWTSFAFSKSDVACLQLDVLAQALIAALQANTFTCTLAIKRNKDSMKLIFGWVSRISRISCSSNRETLKKSFQANDFLLEKLV